MAGARHVTDESGEAGVSDTPYSYGPNLKALMQKARANDAKKDMEISTMREPKPGKELDFN